MNELIEILDDIETTEEYNGYICSVRDAIIIVILGSICGLKNVKQIHQWALNEKISEFLKEKFQIKRIPCYYWLLCLLKLVKPESLNKCFTKQIDNILGEKNRENLTISLDGKTIRSTNKIESYETPLHIVSAYISKIGMTFGQKVVDGKSNEIPAAQELIKELNIKGCVVTADALNCQKETAQVIVNGKGDYLLCVKDNHTNLKKDIEDYIKDELSKDKIAKKVVCEKNRERIEKRIAYITYDINWLESKQEWAKLKSIGAICKEVESQKGNTTEWHYYISSKKMTADELLHHARMEWAVETMHWILDVDLGEDYCRIEDKNIQRNLNVLRKSALNIIKQYKTKTSSKRAISNIMLDCLIDCKNLLKVIYEN